MIGFILIVVLTCFTGFYWLKYEVEKRSGKHTELVDPSPYFQEYALIGIENVSILHPETNSFIPNQNVILKDGLIYDISGEGYVDSTITYINGTDKYLIPGFVDTHVHLGQSKNDLMLYLANGITTVWEMFGDEAHLAWKAEKQNGKISPNIFVATRKIGSQKGLGSWIEEYFGGEINFAEIKAVQNGIREFKQEGYDAIKFGSHLNTKIYSTIIDESKKLGIPAIGHLPVEVGLEYMYGSGFSELGHVEEITKNVMQDFGGVGLDDTEEFLSYLRENVDSIAVNLRRNNIAVSTTVFLMESLPKQKFELDKYLKSIELEYVNPSFIEGSIVSKGWLPGNNSYEDLEILNDEENRPRFEAWWNMYVEAILITTEALIKNGVTLLVGTDANVTGCVPGFSLHKELESLVNAGITTSQALNATTKAPAQWVNMNAGELKVGFKADLVLLNANPIENIVNSKSIETVFTGKFYLLKEERKKLLEAVRIANDKSRSSDISKWN